MKPFALSRQDPATGGATHGIVVESHEADVVDVAGTQATDTDCHRLFGVAVAPRLRAVRFLAVQDRPLRRRRQPELLRYGAEALPERDDVVELGLGPLELEADASGVAVDDRNAVAVRSDDQRAVADDLATLDVAQDLARLLLRLLLLSLDERDDDLLEITQRAGRKTSAVTMRYVREAEVLRDGLGAPFSPLPDGLPRQADRASGSQQQKHPENSAKSVGGTGFEPATSGL
jgi:hypothetical protein